MCRQAAQGPPRALVSAHFWWSPLAAHAASAKDNPCGRAPFWMVDSNHRVPAFSGLGWGCRVRGRGRTRERVLVIYLLGSRLCGDSSSKIYKQYRRACESEHVSIFVPRPPVRALGCRGEEVAKRGRSWPRLETGGHCGCGLRAALELRKWLVPQRNVIYDAWGTRHLCGISKPRTAATRDITLNEDPARRTQTGAAETSSSYQGPFSHGDIVVRE